MRVDTYFSHFAFHMENIMNDVSMLTNSVRVFEKDCFFTTNEKKILFATNGKER